VTRPRRKSLFREYSEAIIIAVLLALFIRQFAVQAFTIPSGSMMDTLLIGDYILVNKFLFGAEIPLTDGHLPGLRDPRHGDVVVFKYPNDETRDFIKRIIAVGGDTIQVRDNRVLLNGLPIDEPYVRRDPSLGPRRPSAATPTGAIRSRCQRAPTSSWVTTGTTPRTAATGASSAARRSAARPS
jgi:signal peptidase I